MSKVILLCLLRKLCRCSRKILKCLQVEQSFSLVSSLSGTSGRAMLAGGSIAGGWSWMRWSFWSWNSIREWRVLGESQPWRESNRKQVIEKQLHPRRGIEGACNHHFLQGYKQRRAMLLAQQRRHGEFWWFCHSCSLFSVLLSQLLGRKYGKKVWIDVGDDQRSTSIGSSWLIFSPELDCWSEGIGKACLMVEGGRVLWWDT